MLHTVIDSQEITCRRPDFRAGELVAQNPGRIKEVQGPVRRIAITLLALAEQYSIGKDVSLQAVGDAMRESPHVSHQIAAAKVSRILKRPPLEWLHAKTPLIDGAHEKERMVAYLEEFDAIGRLYGLDLQLGQKMSRDFDDRSPLWEDSEHIARLRKLTSCIYRLATTEGVSEILKPRAGLSNAQALAQSGLEVSFPLKSGTRAILQSRGESATGLMECHAIHLQNVTLNAQARTRLSRLGACLVMPPSLQGSISIMVK